MRTKKEMDDMADRGFIIQIGNGIVLCHGNIHKLTIKKNLQWNLMCPNTDKMLLYMW